MDDDSPASKIVKQIIYGEGAPVDLIEDLGFAVEDLTFVGWKVYCSDTGCWLAENDSDEVL